MTEPDGIQREPNPPAPGPSGIQREPAAAPAAPITKCPHCDTSLTPADAADGRCWYCEKQLTDPVEPGQPHTPFGATFLLGFVGAVLGIVVGYVLLGDRIGEGSWGVSLCGGIGFATGSALARTAFRKQ